MDHHYLACDLGAESGRLLAVSLVDDRFRADELHRFDNTPVRVGDSLHWNIPAILDGIRSGLDTAAARPTAAFEGFSIDSWGVDYLLFNDRNEWMPPAFHYRDPRTARGVQRIHAQVPWPGVFAETGIQFMPLNTLYQLGAESPERLRATRSLLGIADGLHFILSGVARNELSLASTFQLYHPVRKAWSATLLNACGLGAGQLPEIVPSGTLLGPLQSPLASHPSLRATQVIASCSHDTAAAVAAVPADPASDWAYLSSGTWSLLGVERATPILTDPCRDLNFTNELGHGNTVRLLKNIAGLWILQECRRYWERQGNRQDYAALTQLAAGAQPFASLIHVADPRFVPPGDMPARIRAFCAETGQPMPESPAAVTRCILESLALQYRRTLDQLEQLLDRPIRHLHVVGGGSRNALLNQFTADAIQRPVLAGPVEATALGNAAVQAITLGHLSSLAEARALLRRSFPPQLFQPSEPAAWQAAYRRYCDFP